MWETIKAKLFSKDVWVRAGKTFVQAAVAYLVAALANVDIFSGDNGKTFWVGLLISTLSAAASAAWNGVIKPAMSELSVNANK
jgi:hypothetical protein